MNAISSFHHDGLVAACESVTPTVDHGNLAVAARKVTGLALKVALVDGGWYRLGGLVDGAGTRLADDFEEWAEAECGGDLMELFKRHGGADYHVTVRTGRRIYLTAATGPGPLDFLQFEVDEVQEAVGPNLFEGEHIPDTIEELAELAAANPVSVLAAPRYVFRRVTAFDQLTQLVEGSGNPRLKRFTEEWRKSSAGKRGIFCDHWVLRVQPYRNEAGAHVLDARPLPTVLPSVPDLQDMREHAADYHPARIAQDLDRQAGFPMAWYFLQITQHYAPYRCVADMVEDFKSSTSGVAPLSATDQALADGWVTEPYSFH